MPTLLDSIRAQIADLEQEIEILERVSPRTADHDMKVGHMRTLLMVLKEKADMIR